MRSGFYRRNVGTGDDLFARIFHTAARMKKFEDQPERTRDLRTRFAKCIVANGGIFKHLL
jgi:hypothetical protein